MENTATNRNIKDKLYELWVQYPKLQPKEVLEKLKYINKEVEKQNKEVKNDRTNAK